MTDLSIAAKLVPYKPKHKVRFVTATSLFDGHDASINIMRRILQSSGVEVIHLGHNRSVEEIVNAALQEDAQGIAVSSYQGGHVEFFKYMIDLLKARGGESIKVFGGGGGVIVPAEMQELHDYGVAHLYSVQDGQTMGLQGMINDMVARCDIDITKRAPQDLKALEVEDRSERLRNLAQIITALENGAWPEKAKKALHEKAAANIGNKSAPTAVPTLGITGTGGAGKSSLTDELIRRFRLDQNDSQKIAVISIDPSRKRTGGALLGDRIRMNAIQHPNIYMRSLATRDTGSEISKALPDVIAACKVAGFDFIVVETSGIGQGDAAIVPLVDVSLYVMTPEFGAASQLEKIDMLDFADFVAINKFDRKGAEDALRDVRKQYQRNRERFSEKTEDMPVFGTMAARFNDDGVTALYQALVPRLAERGLKFGKAVLPAVNVKHSSAGRAIVPADRVRYLADIADALRGYHRQIGEQALLARERQSLKTAKTIFEGCGKNAGDFDELIAWKDGQLTPHARKLLAMWPDMKKAYAGDEYVVKIRDKEIRTCLIFETMSGTKVRKVALPRFDDEGELLKFLSENEDPTRMFAGEGDAFRTNKRFLKVSEGMPAKRLSTAFDSVTLYGCDPDRRPDIYGKIGNSGVSIATLDDLKVLYSGFDLCDPATSVSMTINGPAPMILAMFLNAAVDQQIEKFREQNRRDATEEEAEKIREWTLSSVRGTVQADILKEDQGQNTCIFSTEFALKMMGDIAEFFVHNQIRNFYSVSISGYHIAEAGANPISQLAFTLANGFTYVETYLARGMHIDDFAGNLSFFFSNGMDPEYSVIGRVARRIWAVAMKNRYGANERSQKLKYHIQTSGRSLHAQEMDFNDIRTTLQALIAIYDNCNSLHTNAYDEAIIQLIINREWGVAKNENPNQGAFIIEELTDLVEEAVLKEFEAIASRGGVLGAMETGYQRGKIQEESMHYEHKKHDGTYPIIGVNTFLNPHGSGVASEIELARSTEEEKQSQLHRLKDFQSRNAGEAEACLARLKQAVIDNKNVFAVMMEAVRHCSLGQISNALYLVGGQYRRSM
ncbi:MAG: methylmalonyl-CoA mutase [Rhodocyclaceae bacterium]|nr:MAG: methylmalonyl-CoA mutase [Rhodocyclaceae bacterium]